MNTLGRSLDHFVVVVRDLDVAMAAYQRLGFRSLPLMEHSEIGTSCSIVQFHDTYLELLGDFDHCKLEDEVRLVRPRLEAGDGLFMSAFTSANLEADRSILEGAGVALTPIVSARRRVRLPHSGWGETDSRSMFAWNLARPLMSNFLSDHRRPHMIWIREYQMHPNSVERVKGLTYIAAEPQADEDSLSKLLGYRPNISSRDQVMFRTPRGEMLEILSPSQCKAKYGSMAPDWIPSLGGYGVGLSFDVQDLDRCQWALRGGGVPFSKEPGETIRVAQGNACGVVLEFRQREQ